METYPIFKNTKILIINSDPLSGQYYYNVDEFNNHVKMIATHHTVVCTKPIDGILSTITYGLSVKDIAAISINVDVVIAIHTGPFIGLLNVFTINRVKQFYVFDMNHTYDIPKFQMKQNITDISLEELQKYVC
jgi:CTP synthase (UTP-ammonia lyase)